MNRIEIDPFFIPNKNIATRKTVAFTYENKCMLFQPDSGRIILIDIECFYDFAEHNISDGFYQKLVSRGFIEGIKKTECGNICEVFPEFFMIDLTSRCNMRCKYCLRNIEEEGHSISIEMIDKISKYIVDYCEKYRVKHISVQPWGGEPLIEMETILRLREKIKPKGTNVHFSIETNALLLSEKNIDELYKNKIGIGVSIDGTKDTHDLQRVAINGTGTHSVVEKNLLRAIKVFGKRLGTITTLTKNNISHIEEILDYYAMKLKLTHIKFNFVHMSLFFDCSSLCVSEYDISKSIIRVLNKLVELNERGYLIEEHNISTKLKNILTRKYTDICHSMGCCGGRKMIVFGNDGSFYPCELTDSPEEAIGNVYNSIDMIEAVNSSIEGKRDFFKQKKESICDNCDWYEFCRGGCTVRAISCGNSPPMIDVIECAVNRTLYPALVELILKKPEIVNKMLGCDFL